MRRITYISASVKTDAIDPLRKSGGRAHTCDRNKLRLDHGKVSAAGPPLRCRLPPGTEAIAGHGWALAGRWSNSLEEDIWLKSSSPRSIKLRGPRMTKKNGGIKLTILPLTPDLWPALEDLFGKWGASNGCWCMYWRIGGAYRGKRSENKEALREIVKRGSPPGLLAFDGDLAVGWCQVTPRDALPWLDRMWWFRPVDDMRVWAISCFFVRRGYRRQGVMSQLIVAALKTAKRARASALEAYPIDTSAPKSTSNTFTGTAAAFTRAGFREVARRASARPITRHDLKAIPR